MKRAVRAIVLAASISSLAGSAAAASRNICEREMAIAAKKFDVPLGILYAVGLTETGVKGSLQPNAMNIAGRSYFATSRDDALREFEKARRKGIRLIDLGCMQINHHFHAKQFPSLRAMLEPRANVEYAARFLTELRSREGSWTMAVARYHAGPNNDPAQKRYVCAVIRNMVATGFGSWTAASRKFCR